MEDWATKLIKEMVSVKINGIDDATTAFCRAYASGDTPGALKSFEGSAESCHDSYKFYPHGNHYYLYVFEDGSVYYDAKDGIDRFYPSLSDLADEDDDIKRWMDDKKED